MSSDQSATDAAPALRTIKIDGLHPAFTALDIRTILDAIGLGGGLDHESIILPLQPASDLNLGHCWVKFPAIGTARRAVQCLPFVAVAGNELNLRVKFSHPPGPPPPGFRVDECRT